MKSELAALCAAGLAIVPIPPKNGKPVKAPTGKGWNKPRSFNNPNGYSTKAEDFSGCEAYNFGLYHGVSNTLALDIDDLILATMLFAAAGIPMPDWLNNPGRFEIKSPKKNRGKMIYKLPDGFEHKALKQLKHGQKVIFELRCGNCQDVILGQHPDGGEYQLIGNPAFIPDAPAVLLDMLQHWEAWKLCFDSILCIEKEPPKIAPRKPQQGEHLARWRNPIHEFNQAYSVTDVLIRNNYKQVGKDRFIRPGSESKAPGVVIMRNCADGVERVFSHGGDVLNDGYCHDAFDCYRLLECRGEW